MQAHRIPSTATTGPDRRSEPQVAEWIVRLFRDGAPLGFQAGDENLYRYVHNSPTDRTDPSGLFDQGLFWNNVQRMAPEVANWWTNTFRGRIEQRTTNANPYTWFLHNATGTYEAGNPVAYLNSGFNEIEAAQAFIDVVTNGYFAEYWRARNLGNPNLPAAHQEWREWYLREAARTVRVGADVVQSVYSLLNQGVNWLLTLNQLANGQVDPATLLGVARLVPLARGSSLRAANRTGQTVLELSATEARIISNLDAAAGWRIPNPQVMQRIDRNVARLLQEFREAHGFILWLPNIRGVTHSGTRSFGKTLPYLNTIILYEGANYSTLAHELLHFRQARQLRIWGVADWPGSRAVEGLRLEREVQQTMRQWGFIRVP